MSWRMIGKPFTTAEMTGTPTITQKFTLSTTNGDHLLRGLNAGVIFYNNVVFTAVSMQVWTDRSGSPGSLMASSTNSYTKLQAMEGENNAYKVLGFTFDDVPLRAGASYHAVLIASGYTGDDTSNIAWRKSYPDPQYRTGVTLNAAKAANHPLELSVISAKL